MYQKRSTFLYFLNQFFSAVSAFFCCFLPSDLMHFALILLFRFVSVENQTKLRPDVKAYCQTFNTKVPNCLDIK